MSPSKSTGQCQCGKIKYSINKINNKAYLCHCKMCQKSVGNIFAAYINVNKADVIWHSSPPSYYHSSKKAKRGFCPACGTPICFQSMNSEKIDMTVGSLNNIEDLILVGHNGIENRPKNFSWHDELPKYSCDD